MNLLLMKPFSFFPVRRTLYAMDTISLDRKQVLVWLWIELTYRTFGEVWMLEHTNVLYGLKNEFLDKYYLRNH